VKAVWNKIRAMSLQLIMLLSLNVCWTAAHYLTSLFDARMSGQPEDLVRLLVNATLGFLLFGGFLLIVSLFSFPGHTAKFRSIIDAMERMSRGDFHVNVHMKTRTDDQFGKLVRSFNDMAAQLGAMEKIRQEFISNVSHEIQSPLTSIHGFARALRDPGLSEGQRVHYLDIIETECMRLSRLSDNLLKLTTLESEHHPFERKRYRLDKQLREVVLAYEPQWLDKSIDMKVSLEETEIVADPELMNQVWGNLLHNSIKFTPRGGMISVQLRKRDGEAEVRIADTGIGIGEEDLPRIFERFHKADKSRHRTGGGSGLGLAIAKKIVDLHRGSIDAQSKPGDGSVFTVRLPAGK